MGTKSLNAPGLRRSDFNLAPFPGLCHHAGSRCMDRCKDASAAPRDTGKSYCCSVPEQPTSDRHNICQDRVPGSRSRSVLQNKATSLVLLPAKINEPPANKALFVSTGFRTGESAASSTNRPLLTRGAGPRRQGRRALYAASGLRTNPGKRVSLTLFSR